MRGKDKQCVPSELNRGAGTDIKASRQRKTQADAN